MKLAATGCVGESSEHRLALPVARVERILTWQPNSVNGHIVPDSHLHRLFDGCAARCIFAISYQDYDAAGFFRPRQLVTRSLVDGIKYRCPTGGGQLIHSGSQSVSIVGEVL